MYCKADAVNVWQCMGSFFQAQWALREKYIRVLRLMLSVGN